MTLRTLSRKNASHQLRKYQEDPNNYFNSLSNEYISIRNDLKQMYCDSSVFKDNSKLNHYQTDLNFAIKLYEYFNEKKWFDDIEASDFDFWRYICVNVVPDVIEDRHGIEDHSYFYSKNVRMYIPTLWWYIHMSYQGDIESTEKILSNLNTDYILQLVERPGRDGLYLSISRCIMYYIGLLPKKVLELKVNNKNLLRRVMIQNTAKLNNYNLVFDSEENAYVRGLFLNCGVEVEDYE